MSSLLQCMVDMNIPYPVALFRVPAGFGVVGPGPGGPFWGSWGGPGRGARGRGGQNQGPTPILAGVTFAYEIGPEKAIIYY